MSLVGPQDSIQNLHRTDGYKFLLLSQHWYVHVLEFTGECHLWVHSCFFSIAQHTLLVFFVLLGWFVRWEVSGWTAAVLTGGAFRICSKQHLAFLCNLAFFFQVFHRSPGVATIQLYWHSYNLEHSRFILSKRSTFHVIDNMFIAVHTFSMYMLTSLSVDETLLPCYEKWSTSFRILPFNVEMAPSCLEHMNSVFFWSTRSSA